MDDGGQLMLLAGIVLTISFILSALTLAQVSALEREAAAEGSSPIVKEWRFLHQRLASNFDTAVGPDTSLDSFNETVLPTIAATFRGVQAEKGYDLILRKAGGPNFTLNGNEEGLIIAGNYAYWSSDGSTHFTHAADSDNMDGILWQTPCPDPMGPASGCIVGAYIFVRLADATTTVEESILFAMNQG